MNVILHEQTHSQLAAILPLHSGSYIFHGPSSVGKATAAADLARRLNCQGDENGLCAACRQFDTGNYPDLLMVRPEGKASIVIDQVRAVIQALSLSPYYADGTRVVLIDNADTMTTEAQNALLKLIEEPPAQTLFILVTERPAALLPTVRSRCGHIHFPHVPEQLIAKHLVDNHGLSSLQATQVAEAAAGAPGLAMTLATSPDEAAARLDLAHQAALVPDQSRFDRLLLAAKLATSGADLQRFGHLLHTQLTAKLGNGALTAEEAHRGLSALETFRRHLAAKVAPRVALECLMVEL